MIEVKTLFHGWKEITEKRAAAWAKGIYEGAIAMTEEQKIKYINSRLREIQFTKEDL